MARDFSLATLKALHSAAIAPVLFGQFDFVDGPLTLCAAHLNYDWRGRKWYGVAGALRRADLDEQGESLTPTGVEFEVSAAVPEILAALVGRNFRRRRVQLWRGFADKATGGLLRDSNLPYPYFGGFIRNMNWNSAGTSEGGEEVRISVSVTSLLQGWARAPGNRFTKEEALRLRPDVQDLAWDEVGRAHVVYL